jgi:hypothetical protein
MADGEALPSLEPATANRRSALERLGAWFTLIANLGVLLGLMLVILQLNQNERMIQAQTRGDIATGIVELLSQTAGNQQLVEVMVRNNERGELTPSEQMQVQLRLLALLRLWEATHYQYRMGLFDESEFARERLGWKDALARNRGIRAEWCRNTAIYAAEFVAEVNGLIDPQACSIEAQ